MRRASSAGVGISCDATATTAPPPLSCSFIALKSASDSVVVSAFLAGAG
jgi:hypothetical protein